MSEHTENLDPDASGNQSASVVGDPGVDSAASRSAGSTRSTSLAEPERERGRLVIGALIAWTVMVGSLAFAGGWLVNDRIQAGRSVPQPSVIEIRAPRGDYEGTAPDVRGLTVGDAKQVLVDMGVDAGIISIKTIPWAGTADVVIAQDPVATERITDRVVLTVSAAAVVPDVVGSKKGDAVDSLRALGVEPEISEAFDLLAPTGSVLAIEPAAGELLPEVVKLTVAQPGSSLFMADLKAVSSICSKTTANINASAFPNSLSCGTGQPDRPRTGVWLLNRRVQAISGAIGVDDKGKSDATAQITVIGDGKSLGTFSVGYAKPTEINISVAGVLRLEIVTTSPTQSDVVLGTWLLKGTTDDISALESGS